MPPKRKKTSKGVANEQETSSTISTDQVQNNNIANVLKEENIQQQQQQNVVAEQGISDLTDDKKNKRRGRKPKDKFNIDDTFAEQNNSLLDFDNNIVIKLPIACRDLESELSLTTGSVLYNPILSEPQAFNECSESNYGIIDNQDVVENTKSIQINNKQNDKFNTNTPSHNFDQQQTNYIDYYQNKINDLLCDLDDSASKKRLTQIEILLNKKYKTSKQIDLLHNLAISYTGTKWPQTSNICCFWCCHNFDNTPWGIPKKYNAETGIFTMYGIFCSPNCVLAHLLRNETNNISLWEQVSLLNLLHYKIYETDENIIPAPDNVCLRMFGGPLNIQEFRALTLKNEKKYNINFPPCVIITPVLEETKKVFNQDSYYIPIDKKKINKIQTELKIKRTNNVYKNSLENVMNISYNQ
jgi:hypothetical protein